MIEEERRRKMMIDLNQRIGRLISIDSYIFSTSYEVEIKINTKHVDYFVKNKEIIRILNELNKELEMIETMEKV